MNDVVSHKFVILQCRIDKGGSPTRLSGIKVAESQRQHKSVPVNGGMNTSNLYSTGSLWSRRVDSKVHKLDGFPHGLMVLLL